MKKTITFATSIGAFILGATGCGATGAASPPNATSSANGAQPAAKVISTSISHAVAFWPTVDEEGTQIAYVQGPELAPTATEAQAQAWWRKLQLGTYNVQTHKTRSVSVKCGFRTNFS